MEVKMFLLVSVLLTCVVNYSLGLPRDKAFQQVDNELRVINEADHVQSAKPNAEPKTTERMAKPFVMVNGRLWCESQDASEDETCEAHCLPKGYSYGICVSNSCSCI